MNFLSSMAFSQQFVSAQTDGGHDIAVSEFEGTPSEGAIARSAALPSRARFTSSLEV